MSQQWFYGDAELPSNGDASGLTTTGQRYTTDVDCHVVQLRTRGSATAATIGPLYRIYDGETRALLASGSFGVIAPGAWGVITLPTPVPWSAGREIVACRYGDRYVATSGYHSLAITRGHLTTPVGAGIFSEGNDSFPDQPPFNNTSYFIDVRIDDTPDYTPPAVTNPGNKTGIAGTTITPIAMAASGGSGSYTWSATGLPPGLGIRTADGLITGTPTAAGAYSVTVHAADGISEGTASFTITVSTMVTETDTRDVDLVQAGLTYLQADPGLAVHIGRVPDGARPPYVLVYARVDWPDDATGNDLSGLASSPTAWWYCHCVGKGDSAARAVAQRVRRALLNQRPIVAGLDVGLIRMQPGGGPPQRQEDTGSPVVDLVSVYWATANS